MLAVLGRRTVSLWYQSSTSLNESHCQMVDPRGTFHSQIPVSSSIPVSQAHSLHHSSSNPLPSIPSNTLFSLKYPQL